MEVSQENLTSELDPRSVGPDPIIPASPRGDGGNQHPTDVAGSIAGDNQVESLAARLESLRDRITDSWRALEHQLADLHPTNRASARNLVHYLALRRYDIRELQSDLARHGISSLGRAESHVMWNLNKVLKLLDRITGRPSVTLTEGHDALTLDEGSQILASHTCALLGDEPENRKVRIMVTLPTEAATDFQLVRDLISGGMDCARINGAHDDLSKWHAMVDNVRRAEADTGRTCKICVDIPGPKLRTGALKPGPKVLKVRPKRDVFGRVTEPALIWLTTRENRGPAPSEASAHLLFESDFIRRLRPGGRIKFRDASGSKRALRVERVGPGGSLLSTTKTAYVVPDTAFTIDDTGTGKTLTTSPVELTPLEQYALLHDRDRLVLTRGEEPGRPAITTADGRVLRPARIQCTLPQVFNMVKVGEPIWFDDGKLGGEIVRVSDDEIEIAITRAGPAGHKLRGDRGINLPKTHLELPPINDTDRAVLKFAVLNADLVGYSFVRSANDVRELQRVLKQMGGDHLGIILKIETLAAFKNLPGLLLAAMEKPTAGVMIARGDLAVEAGFERMAEVQEEILWMCEAAHVPVIWATQVLEQLSKRGVYSRAEITDAAMSERAECVMLNKGPFVLDAVRTLDDILRRMQSHQNKKRSMMRPLKLAQRFFESI